MNVWDYVTEDDVSQLTLKEYHAFRMYLKFLGYNVDNASGNFRFTYQRFRFDAHKSSRFVLILRPTGNLAWRGFDTVTKHNGTRISLEEVKRMASLGFLDNK